MFSSSKSRGWFASKSKSQRCSRERSPSGPAANPSTETEQVRVTVLMGDPFDVVPSRYGSERSSAMVRFHGDEVDRFGSGAGAGLGRPSPGSRSPAAAGLARRGARRSPRRGEVLPGSRDLAGALGVARGTVVEAYEQLVAEGYLEARTGSGTVVGARAATGRGRARTRPVGPALAIDLRPGVPDLGLFPADDWAWALGRAARAIARTDLGYGNALGNPVRAPSGRGGAPQDPGGGDDPGGGGAGVGFRPVRVARPRRARRPRRAHARGRGSGRPVDRRHRPGLRPRRRRHPRGRTGDGCRRARRIGCGRRDRDAGASGTDRRGLSPSRRAPARRLGGPERAAG